MAMNDFFRFRRNPNKLEIIINDKVQLTIHDGAVTMPQDPASPATLPVGSDYYDTGLGARRVKDGAGEHSI